MSKSTRNKVIKFQKNFKHTEEHNKNVSNSLKKITKEQFWKKKGNKRSFKMRFYKIKGY